MLVSVETRSIPKLERALKHVCIHSTSVVQNANLKHPAVTTFFNELKPVNAKNLDFSRTWDSLARLYAIVDELS